MDLMMDYKISIQYWICQFMKNKLCPGKMTERLVFYINKFVWRCDITWLRLENVIWYAEWTHLHVKCEHASKKANILTIFWIQTGGNLRNEESLMCRWRRSVNCIKEHAPGWDNCATHDAVWYRCERKGQWQFRSSGAFVPNKKDSDKSLCRRLMRS